MGETIGKIGFVSIPLQGLQPFGRGLRGLVCFGACVFVSIPLQGLQPFGLVLRDTLAVRIIQSFNPSSGITAFRTRKEKYEVKITPKVFQSLFRDYSLSDNTYGITHFSSFLGFNPSSGITAFRTSRRKGGRA